jgi:hypothetical protein
VTMIAPACEEHAATSRRSFSLIPLTPFSHKGRRGSLGVLMAETGDGAQGIAKTSTPVRSPYPLLPQEKKGDFGLPDAPHEDCETRRRQKTLYLRAWHPVVILTAKARRTPPRSLAGVRSPTPAGARRWNAHTRPAAKRCVVHQQRRALHLHCPILRRDGLHRENRRIPLSTNDLSFPDNNYVDFTAKRTAETPSVRRTLKTDRDGCTVKHAFEDARAHLSLQTLRRCGDILFCSGLLKCNESGGIEQDQSRGTEEGSNLPDSRGISQVSSVIPGARLGTTGSADRGGLLVRDAKAGRGNLCVPGVAAGRCCRRVIVERPYHNHA